MPWFCKKAAVLRARPTATICPRTPALGGPPLAEVLRASLARLQPHYGDDLDVALVDQRYRFVHALADTTLTRPATPPLTITDRIDQVVTHRWLGIPIFLALMWLVFKLTTDVAGPFVGWMRKFLLSRF